MADLRRLVAAWLFDEVPPPLEAIRSAVQPGDLEALIDDFDALATAFGAGEDLEDALYRLEALAAELATEPCLERRLLTWLFEDGPAPALDPESRVEGWLIYADLVALGGAVLPGGEGGYDELLLRFETHLDERSDVVVAPIEAPQVIDDIAVAAPMARETGKVWPWLALAAACVLGFAFWPGRAPSPPDEAPTLPPIASEQPLPNPTQPPTPFEVLPAVASRSAMRPVTAGEFTMGSPPDEVGRNPDEARRTVQITRDFWLAETEVTQSQWASLMGTAPSRFVGDDRPVEQTNWFEAVEFANRLSESEGLGACYEMADCVGDVGGHAVYTCGVVKPAAGCDGYRLPTEAEWEYAARAGTTSGTYAGILDLVDTRNAPVLEDIAWYSGNSGVQRGGLDCADWTGRPRAATQCATHPVAQKQPNAWGFSDMIGNVWEWTSDWYAASPPGNAAGAALDPRGPTQGRRKVTKGCGWFRDARFCRAANRYRPLPAYRSSVVGFRIARSR